MRVIGFGTRQIVQMLWKENVLQSLFGIILGLPLGYLITLGYTTVTSGGGDLYSLPVAILPISFVFSIVGGLLFVIVASCFTILWLRQLSIVDVLKDRD